MTDLATNTVDRVVDRYHAALRAFFKGDPGPVIQMSSQRDDVVLCNPFRPFARGPSEVAETIEQAASHYADGECEAERVTAFATAELGYTVEIERFTATIGCNEGSGALRVTAN